MSTAAPPKWRFDHHDSLPHVPSPSIDPHVVDNRFRAPGHDPAEQHLAELEHLETLPWFQAGLRIPFRLVETYEVPYVGGVSTDGREIYIDKHFPHTVKVGRRMVDLRPGLVVHERYEGILLRNDYAYHAAHDFATAAENREYRSMGLDPAKAQAVYPRFVKIDESETFPDGVPPYIDMKPYEAPPRDDGLIRRMRAAMHDKTGMGRGTILSRVAMD